MIRKNITLDKATTMILKRLADMETEGNESLFIRKLIRAAFAARNAAKPEQPK